MRNGRSRRERRSRCPCNTTGGCSMCVICGDALHVPTLNRRSFLAAGALAALTPFTDAMAADPRKAGMAPPVNAIAPADALKRLQEGNARYAANTPTERDFSSTRA